MNRDQNNLYSNNFNSQGNNGVSNNQPLNNQNVNQDMAVNQQPQSVQNFQQSVNQMNIQEPVIKPVNTFENININNQPLNNQNIKSKNNKLNKILIIIGGVIIGIIIFAIVVISIVSASSEKLVCKSSEGNITIMHNDKKITGYTSSGMSYDLDAQKEYAEQIGIDAYIKEFSNWFKDNTSGTCTIDGKEVLTDNEQNENEVIQEGKRVGNDEFGYITIPENWTKFIDVDGNSTLQYSYANVYIATLYAVPTTQIDAYNYASNIMTKLQSDGVQNVQGATVSVGKYKAYQVYGYYPNQNIWLVCWFFETEDGKTHYISIEGPDKKSEYFNIPNSFSINK